MKKIFSIALLLIASTVFAQKQSSFTVNFDFNKSDMRPEAAARLDSFVNFIVTKKTSFTIELAGHTDSVGSNEYNDALSLRRTDAVKKYLDDRGLESSNVVKEEGLGKRQPLNHNLTDNERFLNRRVVVNVTIPGRSVLKMPVPEVNMPEVKAPDKKPPLIDTPAKRTITAIVADTATKAGTKFVLRDLIFIGGRHYLVPESVPVIQELLAVMNNNPKLEISIEGHVCCIPGNNDGVDLDIGTANLSEMRAKTVYDYLIRNGIAAKRLSYKGFGHRFPIRPYPEANVEDMNTNRRVEIKIVSK